MIFKIWDKKLFLNDVMDFSGEKPFPRTWWVFRERSFFPRCDGFILQISIFLEQECETSPLRRCAELLGNVVWRKASGSNYVVFRKNLTLHIMIEVELNNEVFEHLICFKCRLNNAQESHTLQWFILLMNLTMKFI